MVAVSRSCDNCWLDRHDPNCFVEADSSWCTRCSLEYCRMNPIRNPASNSRNQRTSLCRIDLSLLIPGNLGEVTQCERSPSRYPAWPGGLNLLEPRLAESHTTVIIPFDDRVIFVRLLNCAEFSSRLSKEPQGAQTAPGCRPRLSLRAASTTVL